MVRNLGSASIKRSLEVVQTKIKRSPEGNMTTGCAR
jgi:hypothetical protein